MRDIVDIRKKASVPAQVVVETYSVLTRLPPRRTVPSERPGAEHGDAEGEPISWPRA